MISYDLHSVAYRFLIVKSEISDINNNTIMESIEIEFFENIFLFKEERHNDGGTKRNCEASSSKGQMIRKLKLNLKEVKKPRKLTPLDQIL